MSQLDEALRRLDGAVARLEAGLDGAALPGAGPDEAELQAEVHRLRSRAADDARLRAEAAEAVREALHDLRGAIGQPAGGMHGNA